MGCHGYVSRIRTLAKCHHVLKGQSDCTPLHGWHNWEEGALPSSIRMLLNGDFFWQFDSREYDRNYFGTDTLITIPLCLPCMCVCVCVPCVCVCTEEVFTCYLHWNFMCSSTVAIQNTGDYWGLFDILIVLYVCFKTNCNLQ